MQRLISDSLAALALPRAGVPDDVPEEATIPIGGSHLVLTMENTLSSRAKNFTRQVGTSRRS